MLATVLTVWCVGSFVVAPFIGRAIRASRRGEASTATGRTLEVA